MNSIEKRPRTGLGVGRIRSWWALLAVVAGAMSAAPAAHAISAVDPSVKVVEVTAVGCGNGQWGMALAFGGIDGAGGYLTRTRVTAGGLVYMDEEAAGWDVTNATYEWNLYADASYGPTTGTFPIPAGQPMTAVFTLERPKGTVLASWTMVAASCDSPTLLYNGPTAADLDGDHVATPADRCPALRAATANGCPVRDRALTLRAKQRTHKLVGTLVAPGFAALQAGQPVEIWKKKAGPDRKVRTVSTDGAGRFKVRVRSGRYYATTPAVIVPSAGEATSETSAVRRVR